MYPTTFYRVSIKAYIVNTDGQVLVVREHDKTGKSWWGLPGGGLDHGEQPEVCLKREIQEELGVTVTVHNAVYTTPFYMDRRDAWLLWVVYRATIDTDSFTVADGITDARFINVQEIAASNDMFEKAIVAIDQTLRT